MDTSVAALGAVEGSGRAADLKNQIINLLRDTHTPSDDGLTTDGLTTDGLTTDEAAAALEENVLSVRPRFTELRKAGIIVDTGNRRRNASGKNAAVWSLTTYQSSIGEACCGGADYAA